MAAARTRGEPAAPRRARMSLPAGASYARRVAGGDINEGWRVILAGGREAFVKTRPGAVPGEYAAEARGLQWLAEPGALRTPRVLEVASEYLVLEWVEPGRLSAEGAEELGHGLAATHTAGATAFGDPGFGAASFGSLQLPNDPASDWPAFYGQSRLLPLARIARERGALSDAGARAVEAVCERLPELAGQPEPPARLHGDLWS
ncbi:MAG: fructosamine kinase family protein, partial [Solirubrobacteraceae bacterium]